MMRRTISRRMALQPQVLMAALLDIRTWPNWRPGVTEVTGVSDSPIRSATAWTEGHTIAGRPYAFLTRVVEFDPPHTLSISSSGDGLQSTVRWTLRSEDEATIVIQDAGAQSHGFRNALAGAAKRFLDQQDHALESLSRYLLPQHSTSTVQP